MGVCCIVFDIDGMLFEFFMNFLNIEKKKYFKIIFFQNNFMFSSRFMLFPTFKKKWCKKNIWGGGVDFFGRFMLFSTLTKIWNIEKFPFTYWLNGRWFLQIVDRDSGNLYPM